MKALLSIAATFLFIGSSMGQLPQNIEVKIISEKYLYPAETHRSESLNEGIVSERNLQNISFKENRIFLNIPINEADTLNFYTDTGGGKMIFADAVEKMGLNTDSILQDGKMVELVDINPFLTEYNYPNLKGRLMVFRGNGAAIPLDFKSGILGASWFTDKVWHFQYLDSKLAIVDSINWEAIPSKEITNLFFQKDSLGHNTTDFPRIPVIVNGDTLQMLFDTGASLALSELSRPSFDTRERFVATSFISQSILEKWHSENPEWRIISRGEEYTNMDIIEVPQVTIGNLTVGPVWFTARPDQNFSKYMSQWMDMEISGAIGGSCFKYFRSIVVDYRNERAWFGR